MYTFGKYIFFCIFSHNFFPAIIVIFKGCSFRNVIKHCRKAYNCFFERKIVTLKIRKLPICVEGFTVIKIAFFIFFGKKLTQTTVFCSKKEFISVRKQNVCRYIIPYIRFILSVRKRVVSFA